MADPVKCRRPSKCGTCGDTMPRGARIVATPKDAKPGEPRRWHHDGCVG